MLGVTRTATDVEIKAAYRKLAMQYHPDRNPDKPEAEEKFKEASEAYSVLADVDKRSAYDRFGHAAVSGAGGPAGFDPTIFQDFGDIFGEIFGFADMFGGAGGSRRNRAQRGGDLREDLELEFDEAVAGVKKMVKTRRRETCETCAGSGVEPQRSAQETGRHRLPSPAADTAPRARDSASPAARAERGGVPAGAARARAEAEAERPAGSGRARQAGPPAGSGGERSHGGAGASTAGAEEGKRRPPGIEGRARQHGPGQDRAAAGSRRTLRRRR